MQGDKSAMSTVMEAAANLAASAKSGLDKTKAVVEEKVERMSTSDEVEKDMASLRKEEKIDLAELRKCKAYAQNAVAAASPGGTNSQSFTDGGNFSTVGSFDTPAAITSTTNHTVDQSSPVAAATDNFVVEDVVGSHSPAVGSDMGDMGVVGSDNAPDTGSHSPAVGSDMGDMGVVGSDNAPDTKTYTAVDSNPTHTGMPAPVVQPSSGGIASADANTGAGTPLGTN